MYELNEMVKASAENCINDFAFAIVRIKYLSASHLVTGQYTVNKFQTFHS